MSSDSTKEKILKKKHHLRNHPFPRMTPLVNRSTLVIHPSPEPSKNQFMPARQVASQAPHWVHLSCKTAAKRILANVRFCSWVLGLSHLAILINDLEVMSYEMPRVTNNTQITTSDIIWKWLSSFVDSSHFCWFIMTCLSSQNFFNCKNFNWGHGCSTGCRGWHPRIWMTRGGLLPPDKLLYLFHLWLENSSTPTVLKFENQKMKQQ